jgi:hypothetical protein
VSHPFLFCCYICVTSFSILSLHLCHILLYLVIISMSHSSLSCHCIYVTSYSILSLHLSHILLYLVVTSVSHPSPSCHYIYVTSFSNLSLHLCHILLYLVIRSMSHSSLSYHYRYLPPYYYESDEVDYICSKDSDDGMQHCRNLRPAIYGLQTCNSSALPFSNNTPTNYSCVNWNQYYTDCHAGDKNPFQGAISFDNIGLAWVAIFQVSKHFSIFGSIGCPKKLYPSISCRNPQKVSI